MIKFISRNKHTFTWLVKSAVILAVLSVSVIGQTTVDLPKLIPELEPEIRRAMIEGKIPSMSIALVSGDKVIWTGAYGESNLCTHTRNTGYRLPHRLDVQSNVDDRRFSA